MWESFPHLRLLNMMDPYMGIFITFKAIRYVGSYVGIHVDSKGYYEQWIPM